MNFEANNSYLGRFITDSSEFEVKVVKVTAKTVTFVHPHTADETRAKIMRDSDGEAFFFPLGRYSMAPVVRAGRRA